MVFNRAGLLERLGNQHDLVDAFIAMFIDCVDRDLPLLEEAIAAADRENAALHAHSIRGTAGNLSADRICAIANRLETAAKEGELADLEPLVATLHGAFEQFKQEVESQ